jgi:hypothetical protein
VAGSNNLFGIDRLGRLELLHTFDDVVLPDGTSIDAVPTNLAFGPDGAVYVSTLTGVPFPEGAASVWRWDGERMTRYAGGLTAAIDLDFGPDGSLYVVEMRSVIGLSGRVLRIAPHAALGLRERRLPASPVVRHLEHPEHQRGALTRVRPAIQWSGPTTADTGEAARG